MGLRAVQGTAAGRSQEPGLLAAVSAEQARAAALCVLRLSAVRRTSSELSSFFLAAGLAAGLAAAAAGFLAAGFFSSLSESESCEPGAKRRKGRFVSALVNSPVEG